jgi:light-regulated signal transduction histidine kinase (bacteriophytochrome)
MTLPALRTSAGINLEDYTKAMLNILEDSSHEKERLEEMQRAVVNILEDFSGEKGRLEGTQRAALNIMEDFAAEKGRLEEVQRAMLNLLDDFGMERERTEAANRELREAIDSLRRAKEAADAANRELESFAYSVAHDLRSPLRAIGGFSQMILNKEGATFNPETRRKFGVIQENAQKMGQLIDDLLRLSRLSRMELNRSHLDMTRLVREVLKEIQVAEPERSFTIQIVDLPAIHGDAALVRQLLANLLSNAVKFTRGKEGARIEVGSVERSGEHVYYVRDNGVGFDMKYYNKLFGVFQRLVSETQFEGTGVGLAIVQRIVQRHGGRVWAEGKVQEGATFYFTIPEKERE